VCNRRRDADDENTINSHVVRNTKLNRQTNIISYMHEIVSDVIMNTFDANLPLFSLSPRCGVTRLSRQPCDKYPAALTAPSAARV